MSPCRGGALALLAFCASVTAAQSAGATASGCGTPALRVLSAASLQDTDKRLREASGLSLSQDGQGLWSLGDGAPDAVLMGFDASFTRRLDLGKDAKDLEGIAAAPDGRLLAVSEAEAAILAVDPDTGHVERHRLKDMTGYERLAAAFHPSDSNDGLEAIAVDPHAGAVLVAKERTPRLLIEISLDLTEIRAVTELSAQLGFRDDDASDHQLDVSGLAVDARTGCLWVLSDRGERLFLYARGTGVVQSYALAFDDEGKPRPVINAEGVAHQPGADRLHIVTDDGKSARLITYQIQR